MRRITYPIETARLRLEPFQETDIAALCKMESDPEVKQYAGGVTTRSQSEQLLQSFIRSVHETGFGAIAIRLRENNQVVGLCGFYPTEDANGVKTDEVEIFYGLARDAWGKGYASEACQALIETGTQQLGLTSIIASVHPNNVRSVHVLKRIGMRFSHLSASDLNEVEHVYQMKIEPQTPSNSP